MAVTVRAYFKEDAGTFLANVIRVRPATAGAVAGDRAIVVINHGPDAVPTPAGWTLLATYQSERSNTSNYLKQTIFYRDLPDTATTDFNTTTNYAGAECWYLTAGTFDTLTAPSVGAVIRNYVDAVAGGAVIPAASVAVQRNGSYQLHVISGDFGAYLQSNGNTDPFTGTAHTFRATGLANTNLAIGPEYSAIDLATSRTASSPISFTNPNSAANASFVLTTIIQLPTNTAPGAPVVTAPNGGETIDASTNVTWTAATDPDGEPVTYQLDYTRDNGATWVAIASGVTGTSYVWNTSAIANSTACLVRIRAFDGSLYGPYDQSNAVFTIQHNVAPTAPTGLAPAGNTTVDRTAVQRLSWTFTDPNPGDTQSKFDLQWRLGTGAWNPVTGTTPNQFWDAPGATFPAGTIEWQVRTYDSLGVVGPYSASAFFVAATPPAAATITIPVNGSTVGTSTGTLDWSAPAQDSYQVRKVADNAGAADTTIVYYDSGEVISSTARNAPLSYPVNNRYEHLQVRIKVNGLWSSWASVRVLVSYTPPAVPTLIATPDSPNARIVVQVANPPPNLMPTDASASFEDGTIGGWALSGATGFTFANSAVNPAHGAKALAISRDATAAAAASKIASVQGSTVLPNTTYVVSATVVTPVGSSVRIGLEAVAYGTTSYAGTGAPQRISDTVTVPGTGAPGPGMSGVVLSAGASGVAANAVLYVDAVQIEQGSVATPFHLPSTPAVASNDLHRRKVGATDAGIRIAKELPGNALAYDRTPASGVPYEYLVRALGVNNTSSDSAWTP